MPLRVTIHQPEHMPWLGFFHKMHQADLYVILDSVQFTKNNWQNRNKFVDREGKDFWLTAPVDLKGHTERTIAEMELDARQPWARKYWGRLRDSYCRHPYFESFAPRLETILNSGKKMLVDLNLELIEFMRGELGIRTPMMRSSDLSVKGARSELLHDICCHLGATSYLSGPSGKDYLDQALFEGSGIQLEFHSFTHPVYPAKHFHPYLSALDLLMNCGPESRTILLGGDRA